MGARAGPARPPNYPAYYVALGGVLLLLLMLCCYVLYFCCSKINELSKSESLMLHPTSASTGYPVQPAVRSGAAALVQLCQDAPTLDTQSSARSEPTLSTEVSETGPTLEPSGKLLDREVR